MTRSRQRRPPALPAELDEGIGRLLAALALAEVRPGERVLTLIWRGEAADDLIEACMAVRAALDYATKETRDDPPRH